MLGTRALQIFDDTTCVVRAVLRWTEFYKHESCGKCTPCREGTWWLVQVLAKLEQRPGQRGRPRPAARPVRQHHGPLVLRAGRRRGQPDQSSIKYFRDEYLAHLDARRLPVRPGRLTLFASSHGASTHDHHGGSTTSPGRETDLVTLTIDGIQVSVPKDTLVIRAAEEVGVQIPRFCDHPLLEPVGACRQCLVDIPDAGNGRGVPEAAGVLHDHRSPRAWWSTPRPPREVADKAQQGIMEFLLINHPLDCPVCDKGGECPLQNQAMSNGRGESRFDGA